MTLETHSSEACCTIPPVSATYTPKGDSPTIASLRTYRTGPSTAKTAIILIYDVFGFSPQIQQGADLLAHATSGPHQYQVFIPGFLEGVTADPAWFPPDSAEKRAAMGKYFGPSGPAGAAGMIKKLENVVEALKGEGMEKFAVVGYCWGAKVSFLKLQVAFLQMLIYRIRQIVSLTTIAETAFSAAAEVHPSALAVEDASKIIVPLCILASKDEDTQVVKKFGEALKVPSFIDTYSEAPHGWMTSRGDLHST
ncbi:hypothetical protein EJ08DRAFT_679211 [Tothia fuscella]|uniref:Dienelactone hydrolase domain-containing protein n=1 Tax=Tothia fuscella TaxID=1048955 RepID=A0A9P4NQW1_9PEZI|nr:hypothetical protein EJ08DRAFT_679211 [Tothia fuscella]